MQEAPGAEELADLTRQLFGEAGRFITSGDTAILARGDILNPRINRRAPFVAGTVRLADGRQVDCISLRLVPPSSRIEFWESGFWTSHRDVRQTHRRQLQEIADDLRAHPPTAGLIVGGDFNLPPHDPALKTLPPDLIDTFAWYGVGWGATGPNDWPLFRVDQIWTNPHVTPLLASAWKTRASDHRIVVFRALLE